MANLQRMLGTMLATRMGGRGGVSGLVGTALLGGLGGKAGLAAMGYLAYRAYRDRQAKNRQDRPQQDRPHQDRSQQDRPQAERYSRQRDAGSGATGIAGITGAIGGIVHGLTGSSQDGTGKSFGERIGNLLDPRPDPEQTVEDQKALLLIRAMIAAASSDGAIKPDERRRIVAKLDEAGAEDADRQLIQQELDSPKPLDALLREVKDAETARQFYLASRIAVEGATPTQKSYLEYLRQRLNLHKDDVEEVERMAEATAREAE